MLDLGDGGAELPRDGGQRRQIHVDADGDEDRQQPEQGDQLDPPSSRKIGAGEGITGGGGMGHRTRGMGPMPKRRKPLR